MMLVLTILYSLLVDDLSSSKYWRACNRELINVSFASCGEVSVAEVAKQL